MSDGDPNFEKMILLLQKHKLKDPIGLDNLNLTYQSRQGNEKSE